LFTYQSFQQYEVGRRVKMVVKMKGAAGGVSKQTVGVGDPRGRGRAAAA
jgi:hypothetical protein